MGSSTVNAAYPHGCPVDETNDGTSDTDIVRGEDDKAGCACNSGPTPGGGLAVLLAALVLFRRRLHYSGR